MRVTRAGSLLAVLLLAAMTSEAVANRLPSADKAPVTVCGGSADGCGGDPANFGAGGDASAPGRSGGGSGGVRPVGLPDTYRVYEYAPTCTGNTPGVSDTPCEAAITSCVPRGQSLVRYWVWHADIDRRTGRVLEPGWVLEPGTVCLGPAQQGVPVAAAIAGVLASEFQKLVVAKGVAHVDPKDATLVNFETGFWTDAKTYQLAPVQILGHRVVVTAKPERFDWHFGDGQEALDAGPGRSRTTDVSHTYDRTGLVRPYVVITWSGTFTVDGGAALPVVGTARTTGDGTPLQVKEAHAELVS